MPSTASAQIASVSASLLSGLDGLFSPAKIVTFLFLVYFLLFWLSLVAWLAQDMETRPIDPRFKKIFFGLVIVFNLLGVFLYLVWRPATFEETERGEMEDEILRLELARLRSEVSGKKTEK